MPQTRPAGPYPLSKVKTTSWMIRFDKKGRCVSPATQAALLKAMEAESKRDVIFFSHGWQTDFDGAEETYAEFMQKLEALAGGDAVDPKQLLFVGVTWPSKWLPGTEGPTMAAAAGQQEESVGHILEDMAEALSDVEAADLYSLGGAASLNEGEARRLAELMIKATGADEEAAELGDDVGPPDPDTVLTAWRAISREATTDEPDYDTPGLAGGGAAATDVAVAGEAKFDPLDAVRMFSLYQMKDRAGLVGAGDVSVLLDALAVRARSVYAVGHSFGCKVMLSAVKRAKLEAGKAAPVSMLLLQPALSHLAFSANLLGNGKPAGYADVPARVKRIFTTFSSQDWPLHGIFHLALLRPDDVGDRDALKPAAEPVGEPPNRFAALGGYGPREVACDLLNIGADDAGYGQVGRKIVALNGTGVITSHTDVRKPQTARALRKLMG